MKKRTLIQVVLALLVGLLFILSACSSSNEKSSASSQAKPSESKPVRGGTFTFALATNPDALDPQVSGLAVSTRVNRNIYDNLIYKTESGQFKPWLATKWEVSDDRKSYTFTLRKDVTFQDGTKFNAEAVKFTFDRILDPKTKAGANSHAAILNYVSAEVLDEYTVKINLSKPSAPFLNNVSQSNLAIVSPTSAKKLGDQFSTNPVGSGPYKFVEWAENDQIVLERNEDYKWGPPIADNKGPGYVDKLVFKITPEEATRIGSVESGQVDAAETVPSQNVISIKNSNNLKLIEHKTTGMPFVFFINQTQAPWDQLKARQALQAGIDVNNIVKTLYLGVYERAWSAVTPGILGYDKSLENKDFYNPKKANQLLDELGWKIGNNGYRQKDGQELTFQFVRSCCKP
ncbi:ABC transporter substrate-binding protein [Bacillus sp. 03113]|uniref:ABC transporter substrate-binding protein n=1 Tax=Bacillus sp. 03113 TaxID=2578211 RepID=UPI00215C0E99|nr:ABC transporter substrate-binding protein [Bacillus sp. 03113]